MTSLWFVWAEDPGALSSVSNLQPSHGITHCFWMKKNLSKHRPYFSFSIAGWLLDRIFVWCLLSCLYLGVHSDKFFIFRTFLLHVCGCLTVWVSSAWDALLGQRRERTLLPFQVRCQNVHGTQNSNIGSWGLNCSANGRKKFKVDTVLCSTIWRYAKQNLLGIASSSLLENMIKYRKAESWNGN